MTNQITAIEFELVVRGQSELREDFQAMAAEHRNDMSLISNSQIDLNNKFATYIERSSHADKEREVIKSDIKELQSEVKVLNNNQTGNKVRWQVLGAGILSLITLLGFVVSVILWAMDK